MTEAERKVAEAKANATAKTQPKSKDSFSDPEMQSALTNVSDTQYQRGLDMAKAIAEHSFMRGVSDQINAYLEAPEISEEMLVKVVSQRFQNLAAKRLKPATAVLSLPAFWDNDEDGNND